MPGTAKSRDFLAVAQAPHVVILGQPALYTFQLLPPQALNLEAV